MTECEHLREEIGKSKQMKKRTRAGFPRAHSGPRNWVLEVPALGSLLFSTISANLPVFQAPLERLPWFSLALLLSSFHLFNSTYCRVVMYSQERLPPPVQRELTKVGQAGCVCDLIFYHRFLYKVWPVVGALYTVLEEYMSDFKFIQQRELSKVTEAA